MENYFASLSLDDSTVLCVGAITSAEARDAADAGGEIDGLGYYLFLASEAEPTAPITLLAKFMSEETASLAAGAFARRSNSAR